MTWGIRKSRIGVRHEFRLKGVEHISHSGCPPFALAGVANVGCDVDSSIWKRRIYKRLWSISVDKSPLATGAVVGSRRPRYEPTRAVGVGVGWEKGAKCIQVT